MNKDFVLADKSDTTVIGGEKALSNVTMETFTQENQRCFSCHRTKREFDPDTSSSLFFPPKLIGVSHILTNAYFNLKKLQVAKKGDNK